MSSLRKKAIQGTIWTIAGYGASQVLRLGSNLILTRLLLPEFFGLMALVNVFIIGLNLFSDVGLGPSIIQNKRGDDPDFLNTAWTIQVMRGVVLWLGSLLIAWPISHFYAKPELLWLIPIVGLATLISGFDSTALLTLNRQLAVGKLAIFELMGQVISLIVMIVWAKFDPSIRALVAGTFVSAVFQLLWSHRLLPHQPNRFAWDKEAAQKIFTFGKWIFFSTALTFLASQADRLILGKLITATLLGIYGIAYTFADIPRSVILALSGKVIFPTFAKLVTLPRETFRAKILKNRKLLLLALAAGLSILVGFGDYVIYFLYKKEYHEAAWMLPIIALGIWHTSLYSTMSPALLALGKPIYNTLGYLFTLITITIGLLVGYHSMKMPGAVIAVAVGDFPFYMVTMYGLWREKLGCLKQDLWTTAVFLSLLAAVLVVRVSLLHLGLPIDSMFKLN
jgi:O-antigen/teichoic acid export membrane protein